MYCFIFYVSVFSIYESTPNPHIDVSQVLNTVFWLGKAASGCASFSGPTLNLKEFEGLLAQMKVVSEHSEEDRAGRGKAGRQTERQIWMHGGGAGDGFVSFLSLLGCRRDRRQHIFVFVTPQLLLFRGEREKKNRI